MFETIYSLYFVARMFAVEDGVAVEFAGFATYNERVTPRPITITMSNRLGASAVVSQMSGREVTPDNLDYAVNKIRTAMQERGVCYVAREFSRN